MPYTDDALHQCEGSGRVRNRYIYGAVFFLLLSNVLFAINPQDYLEYADPELLYGFAIGADLVALMLVIVLYFDRKRGRERMDDLMKITSVK
jgi:hypothetical protein